MSVRPLGWGGNPKVPRADLVVPVQAEGGEPSEAVEDGEPGKLTKNQQKKLLKQQQNEAKKAEKAAARAAAQE